MSHHHDHGSCGNESHDHSHDHDQNTSDLGPQDNLYIHIDRPNVVALNTNGKGQDVIKPWHERLDESTSIESDADDQMYATIKTLLFHILKSVELFAYPSPGPLDFDLFFLKPAQRIRHLPKFFWSVILLTHRDIPSLTSELFLQYANAANLDFDDVASRKPTQEFEVAQGRDVGEYAVKTTQFSNLSSLTLFFPASQGAETVQIYYIGLLGHWSERKNNPVITVYETQANIADHPKIQGMDGMFSKPGM